DSGGIVPKLEAIRSRADSPPGSVEVFNYFAQCWPRNVILGHGPGRILDNGRRGSNSPAHENGRSAAPGGPGGGGDQRQKGYVGRIAADRQLVSLSERLVEGGEDGLKLGSIQGPNEPK